MYARRADGQEFRWTLEEVCPTNMYVLYNVWLVYLRCNLTRNFQRRLKIAKTVNKIEFIIFNEFANQILILNKSHGNLLFWCLPFGILVNI